MAATSLTKIYPVVLRKNPFSSSIIHLRHTINGWQTYNSHALCTGRLCVSDGSGKHGNRFMFVTVLWYTGTVRFTQIYTILLTYCLFGAVVKYSAEFSQITEALLNIAFKIIVSLVSPSLPRRRWVTQYTRVVTSLIKENTIFTNSAASVRNVPSGNMYVKIDGCYPDFRQGFRCIFY